jgi:hypothetical protein
MRNIVFRIILPLFILVPITTHSASYYGSGSYGDIGFGVRYDSNLSRAQMESDRKEDFINNFNARYGYQKVLSQNSLFNISADIAYERMAQFKDLNNIQLGGSASYYYQPSLGYFNPWYEATLRLNHLKFNNSKIRDSLILDSSLKVGKRFTNKLSGFLAYTYNERYSDENVFDLTNHIISSEIEYGYTRSLIFFAGYKLEFGEVVSTAIPNAKIRVASESIAPDDVFSAGIGPGCLNRRCAYRLDATSHKLNAGVNMSLGESSEIELATQYHHSDAAGGNRYQGLIYNASFWYAY